MLQVNFDIKKQKENGR